ncbi:hypothetical protein PAHAL_3G175900 [Panicum hallii]|uniref:KIB1-4 beta-propeller domain-containing protein n=1 Tax=Panicum hallii TaxID=206008 RepID=A0A2S3H9U9_9POAL|nr:uncharacterized protein LOC112885203 [Panicum hallii]PAN18072.1 hypothetical protein PAHAL_3G175900 [Panicum hallii]
MAARRSWADLHDDLFAEIARRLPCLADRVHAAWACRSWRDVVLQDPSPPQLPWLLLPYQSAAALPHGATRRASFFCVLCDRAHRVAVPHFTGRARFFGAYPGGCLFLAYGQSYNHGLINLRTHESIHLPDYGHHDGDAITRGGLASQHPMLILAATLSAPPYFSFSGKPHITFWRMGSRLASCTSRLDAAAEDVIYHNGAFHFVTRRGDLLVCTPEFQNEAPVEQLRVRSEYRITVGLMNAGARYLVECRGELLMVLRDQAHQEVTSSFRVFRMTPEEQAVDADGIVLNYAFCSWTELPALDGRMLFVGRGCSTSFEDAHFPGSQEGVYFLDDGSFHAAPMICYGDGPLQYSCCNDGVWSGAPGRLTMSATGSGDNAHQPTRLLLACCRSCFAATR